MNKLKFLFAIMFCGILLTAITSCSKHDVLPQANQSSVTGDWKLTLFFDSNDETSNFSGYKFSFNSGNTVTATNGSNTVSGTWKIESSEFKIDFGTTAVFSDLNHSWLIEENTGSSLKLKDDNISSNEKLQFLKL